MHPSPTITIVIPVYNGAKYIAATLESILAQTLSSWECVIMDDGSSDNSADVVSTYLSDERIKYFRQANAGVSAARNAGYENSDVKSEFVIFLDADDVWEPDALELLSVRLADVPESPAAYGISGAIDSEGKPTQEGHFEHWMLNRSLMVGNRRIIATVEEPTSFAMLAFSNCIVPPGAILIRRAAFESVGRFDQGFSMHEDHDLWLRLSRLGSLILINQRVVWYRQHGENSSSNRNRMVRQRQRLWAKTASSPANTPEQRAVVLHAYKSFYRCQGEWSRSIAFDLITKGKPLGAIKLFLSSLVNSMMSLAGCPKMKSTP